VGGGDPLDDRKSEPGSLISSRKAGLEHILTLIGADTGSIVRNGKASISSGNCHGNVLAGVFDAVAEQVLEQLS
jgi:hypothetical protein